MTRLFRRLLAGSGVLSFALTALDAAMFLTHTPGAWWPMWWIGQASIYLTIALIFAAIRQLHRNTR